MAEIRKWSTEANTAAQALGEVRKYIRKVGDKWKVYSEDGEVLGTHPSKDEAKNQLAAIEVNKAQEVAIAEATLIEKDEDFEALTKEWSDEARAAAAEARRRNAQPIIEQPSAEAPKPPSKKAHDEISGHGWQHRGEGVYEHPSMPGHKITVTARDETRARQPVKWTHEYPDGRKVESTGAEQLGYHAMQENLRAERDKRDTSAGPTAPTRPGYPRPDGSIEKDFAEPTATDVFALQVAFDAYMKTAGFVLKAEQLETVTAEQVELDGDVAMFRITHPMGRAYFAVSNGEALHLPQYRTIGKNGLVPVAKSEEQRYTLGVVYTHGESDFHNDTMTPEELEKAAWAFMAKDGMHGRVGLMHAPDTDGAGRVVESYIYRGPEWMTKAADEEQDQTIKPGDWLLGVIWEPKAWELVKSGRVAGYSLQGLARKG